MYYNMSENNYLKIEDVKKIIPDRIRESHKGTYGRVALLGGALEYSGAIRLSAMAYAALKSGAGLSTIAVPRFLVPVVSQNILEVMIYPMECSDREIVFDKKNIDGLIDKFDVLTCGMGLGKSKGAYEIINYIVKHYTGKLVLDADALNILSENTILLSNTKARVVLTPHMMEFKRLFDGGFGEMTSFEEFEKNKLENAKKFVDKYNITLLLKGPKTIVIRENRISNYDLTLVDRGTPGMATAGSGDVLSGIITGFLGYIDDEFDAARVAAFVNGLAGELASKEEGEISMTSSDTIKNISKAIKMIKES